MNTTDHCTQEAVGLTGGNPDSSSGNQPEASWHQSKDGLKQRLAELEQRVAELSAQNADLVRVNTNLADAQRLLQAILDNVPDRIYWKDTQSRFLKLSRTLAKRLGVTDPDQAIGKTDFDFQPPDRAKEFYEDEQRMMRTGEALINKTERQVLKNGEIAWTSTTKAPLRDAEGKVIGLVGINRDVTELKNMQEAAAREKARLQFIFDSVPVGISLVMNRPDGASTRLINDAHLRICGLTREQADIPDNFQRITHPDDQPRQAELSRQLEEGKIDHYSMEKRYVTLDGRLVWTVFSYQRRKYPDGSFEELSTVVDITELKEAEAALRLRDEKLREFAGRLERSNRELQDFAYVASHDLQEPLRKIVVFGERLKEKNADTFSAESFDYLERMQKAGGRMQSLITDLLTFSRVTTKAKPFAPVNLAEVAAAVVDDLEGRIELVKGRVELGALPIIDAEPVQMRQLLQNLIGNALKFRRPEEPPVVKVQAQLTPDPLTPEKKMCQLTVSDNCIGFDEKYVDRIFNVFQRLHTRNEYEGTGMGLAIVRKIALYHGGDITAKSKPGEGSTFILSVPASHPQPAQDSTANEEDAPS
jgi:PAS domain S-box-containing protein